MAIITEILPIQTRMTGWKILIFCLKLTMNIAAMVATNVAIMHGMKISIGLAALAAERKAMMLTGIRVRPEACRQRNIICGLEATALFGFNSCKLSMAFIPKGVAALSRPRRFAEKFI